MPAAETMLAFVLATAVVVAIPGPSVAYVVTRSVEHGVTAGLVSVLGLESAVVVHAVLSAVGISAVLAVVPYGTQVIAWAGAAYLVWLAVRTLRHARSSEPPPASVAPTGRGRLFLDGLLVDLLNPKTALFFLAFLPQFVDHDRGPAPAQLAMLGAVFVLVAAVCDSAYAVLAGRFSVRLRGSCTARRRLGLVSGGVYLALAALALVM